METHNEYCLQVPYGRKGCYCWEGDQRIFYEARVERLQAECDRWRTIAEKAISELERAVKMLETLNGTLHD